MTIVKQRIGLIGLLAAASLVVGCESGLTAQRELEQANLEKAVYCMELLEVELDLETATRECFGDSYIQHSPHVPDGLEAVLAHFANRIERYPESTISIKRAAAEGDLVWIHLHSKRSPDALGTALIHIFRMENGRF
ncbi:MAG: nuclear transport factor 2 family protein, partial [Pseudomonadota bacterium]